MEIYRIYKWGLLRLYRLYMYLLNNSLCIDTYIYINMNDMNVHTIYVSNLMQYDTRIARISRWGQVALPCPLTRPMVQKCQGSKGSIFGAQHQLPFSSALHPSQNAPHAKVWSVSCFSSGGLRERGLSALVKARTTGIKSICTYLQW